MNGRRFQSWTLTSRGSRHMLRSFTTFPADITQTWGPPTRIRSTHGPAVCCQKYSTNDNLSGNNKKNSKLQYLWKGFSCVDYIFLYILKRETPPELKTCVRCRHCVSYVNGRKRGLLACVSMFVGVKNLLSKQHGSRCRNVIWIIS